MRKKSSKNYILYKSNRDKIIKLVLSDIEKQLHEEFTDDFLDPAQSAETEITIKFTFKPEEIQHSITLSPKNWR